MINHNMMIVQAMLLVCVKELEMAVDLKKQNQLGLLSKMRDLGDSFKSCL